MRRLRFPPILLLAGLLAVLAVGSSSGQTTKVATQRLGEFTIRNFAVFDTQFGTNTIVAALSGRNLIIASPQYEMAAPQIKMTIRKTGKPPQWKASEANATGGVRIVIQRPEAQQTTTVTSDRASYTAGNGGANAGRIDLKGNVRSVTRDPAFAAPLVQNAASGVIQLLGPNATRIQLFNGGTTVTPREPKAKPKE